MRKIVNLIAGGLIISSSCTDRVGKSKSEQKIDPITNSMENIVLDEFHRENINAFDLLNDLVLYGYDTNKYKLSLLVEGDVVESLKGVTLSISENQSIHDVLNKICDASGTVYHIENSRIIIKRK